MTCILGGVYWDISWHMSIGRDTFWTPAHLLIQAGGVLGGGSGAWQILATTFRPASPARAVSVRVWGFRGPLGAFFAAWGAATMLVSAPFDNWWHSAYGLDVKILSPPHVVLTLGILGVANGGVLQIAAALGRSAGGATAALRRALLVVAGEVLVLAMIATLEFTFRSNLHNASAYRAVGIVAPLVMLAFARPSEHRWAATIVAGTYMAVMIVGVWLFACLPAEPKLGPVYQPITHYVPLQFPVLVIAPAVVLDIVRRRLERWPRIARAALLGPLFVAVLVAVEWPFASFQMSDAARTWVFGTAYHPYFMHPDWPEPSYRFFRDGSSLGVGLAIAAVLSAAASYLGLVLGDAIAKVRR
nr:hypothetical protein [Kofleriaceae bacterium]